MCPLSCRNINKTTPIYTVRKTNYHRVRTENYTQFIAYHLDYVTSFSGRFRLKFLGLVNSLVISSIFLVVSSPWFKVPHGIRRPTPISTSLGHLESFFIHCKIENRQLGPKMICIRVMQWAPVLRFENQGFLRPKRLRRFPNFITYFNLNKPCHGCLKQFSQALILTRKAREHGVEYSRV